MKKIVILSDTHRNLGAISSIYDIMRESDYIFHLGDHYDDLDFLAGEFKNKLYRVYGNCDAGYDPKEIIVEIEGCRIFATHGDLYGVKRGNERLIARAKELGCNVALYGHTHRAEITEIDGLTVVNPGSAERSSANKSFCYAVVSGEKFTAVINTDIG